MTPAPADPVDVVAELEAPPPWRSPIPFLWLAIAMLVTAALAALATGAADPDEDEDAGARIVAAAGSMTATDFGFSLVIEFDEAENPALNGVMMTMEGRYDADRRRTQATTSSGITPVSEMELVNDGGRVQYLRFPSGGPFPDATGGKPWGRYELPERPEATSGPTPFTENPLERLAELGELRSPVVEVGEENVRGVRTVRYRTTIDKSERPSPTGKAPSEEYRASMRNVRVDVWIDGTNRFRRFRESSVVADARLTTTLEVFDVGQPVTIELPPEDQVGPFDPKTFVPSRPASSPDGD